MARYKPQVTDTNSTFAFLFLFLYTAAVFIRPHEMSLVSEQWILIKVLALSTLAACLVAQRPLKLYPQHWMLFLLAPIIIISGFVNGSGMWGVSQASSFISSSLIPLFLFSNCISNLKRQHWIMIASITAALCMVHNGHYQQTSQLWEGWAMGTQAVPLPGTDARRITYLGFFNDPNDIGMFLVMNIPFVIYFFVRGGTISKILSLLALVTLLYGVHITHSRGTALGVVALIGAYYLVVKAGARLFIAAMCASPLAIIILTFLQKNVDESASGRLEAWYTGIQMLISYPLGIGKGAFADHHGLTAHNSYVLVAGELGFIGYSLWGGAIFSIVLAGYLFIKKSKNIHEDLDEEAKDELRINKALFFSMVGFMITSFFLSRSYTVLLFIFVGITMASHHRVINKIPNLSECFTRALAVKCMIYAWSVIIVVYIALKLAL